MEITATKQGVGVVKVYINGSLHLKASTMCMLVADKRNLTIKLIYENSIVPITYDTLDTYNSVLNILNEYI